MIHGGDIHTYSKLLNFLLKEDSRFVAEVSHHVKKREETREEAYEGSIFNEIYYTIFNYKRRKTKKHKLNYLNYF